VCVSIRVCSANKSTNRMCLIVNKIMEYMREWHLDSLVTELRDMSVEQLKQLQLSDWKTLTGGALKANIVFNVLKPKNQKK